MGINHLELLGDFTVEALENIDSFERELQVLSESFQKESVDNLYRAIHTIKGSAGFLGLKLIGEISHSLEGVLDLYRDKELEIHKEAIAVFYKLIDLYRFILDELSENEAEPEVDLKLYLQALSELATNGRSATVLPKLNNENSTANEIYILPEDQGQIDEHKTIDIKKPKADVTVRVKIELLEKIMNEVGELVLNRNQLLQMSDTHGESIPELQRLSFELNNITSGLQNDIMSTRMQPISKITGRFERLVRDLSESTGKSLKIHFKGLGTELDRTLMEKIVDPLTHLIRNCADHGIEESSIRLKNKKSPTGNIYVEAKHESGVVVLEIKDDGKGIDIARIKAKAIEKKLISTSEIESLDNKSILSFIFHPGFSTAEKITGISGRGVGMDVVKSNIESIGGSVDIDSKEGQGSIFTLKIPLTLAIIPALKVRIGNSFFLIPQHDLLEVIKPDSTCFENSIQEVSGYNFFRLRGQSIPVLDLGQELSGAEIDDGFLVIVDAGGQYFGLLVDQILDPNEIVVKTIDMNIKRINYYSGATILGDGAVSLILDIKSIFRHHFEYIADSDLFKHAKQDEKENVTTMEYLLFELQDESKYAMTLEQVFRLENFKKEDITEIANKSFLKYEGNTVLIVPVLETLGITHHNKLENYNFILFKRKQQMYAFPVKQILDVISTTHKPDNVIADNRGIVGNVFIEEEAIIILNANNIISHYCNEALSDSTLLKLNKPKILIVEDSKVFQQAIASTLEKQGIVVLTANNGQEALEILKNNQNIDMIITDLDMPVMNGEEFIVSLRSHNEYHGIPILVLSAREDDRIMKNMISKGANEYLVKFDESEIIETINTLLSA